MSALNSESLNTLMRLLYVIYADVPENCSQAAVRLFWVQTAAGPVPLSTSRWSKEKRQDEAFMPARMMAVSGARRHTFLFITYRCRRVSRYIAA